MNKYLLIITFTLLGLSRTISQVYASSELDELTRNIHSQLNLGSHVPFNQFRSGYLRYLRGKRDGEFSKPYIVFVNFDKPSSEERMFIVDVSQSTPRLMHSDYTTHGSGSGGTQNATNFTNTSGDHTSSLGYYKVSEFYQSTIVGPAIKLDGLSGSLNDQARPRGIVMHMGWYADRPFISENGYVGRSHGCFVVPSDIWSSIKSSLTNGSMLYAFNAENVLDPESDDSLLSIAHSDTSSPGDSFEREDISGSLSDHPQFQSASPTLGRENGVDDAPLTEGSMNDTSEEKPEGFDERVPTEGAGQVPFSGSVDFQECQKNANRPWNEVAAGIQSGAPPDQYFNSSWIDNNNQIKNTEDTTLPEGVTYSQYHLAKVRACVAVAHTTEIENFQKQADPNAHDICESEDEKIRCEYHNSMGTDFQSCCRMVAQWDEDQKQYATLQQQQGEDYAKAGLQAVGALEDGDNIQGSAAIVAANLTTGAKGVADERGSFKSAQFDNLASSLAAMPTHRTLMQKCRAGYQATQDNGITGYKASVKDLTRGRVDAPIPQLGDPCAKAINGYNIRYIQNSKARQQAKKLLKEVGYDISELTSQSQQLGSQASKLKKSPFGMAAPDTPSGNLNLTTFESEQEDLKKKEKGNTQDFSTRSPSALKINRPNYKQKNNGSLSNGGNHDLSAFFKQGGKQSTAAGVKKIYLENEASFVDLLKNGSSSNLLEFMMDKGLNFNDIEYAFKKGIIDQKRFEFLSAKLKGRIGKQKNARMVNFRTPESYESSKNNKNSTWQVVKDKNKSIFEIISHRYYKKTYLFGP